MAGVSSGSAEGLPVAGQGQDSTRIATRFGCGSAAASRFRLFRDQAGISSRDFNYCVFRNAPFHHAHESKMIFAGKKTRPESRVKTDEKRHPWSRAEEIVAPRRPVVQHMIWNSTFHQTTRITLEKA
ncbi:MAG TPA: hypothetical protein VIH96_09535 [Paraburkholderia sp.]|jgi:hypothetical protein